MPNRRTKEFVNGELPHLLLSRLYGNARASFRGIGRDLGISYHTVAAAVKALEDRYGLVYTLRVDKKELGFPQGRLITIKFGRRPDVRMLKERFRKDIYVQAAYMCEGDFDLVLYVVGVSQDDFQTWQFNIRIDLGEYSPMVKFSVLNQYTVGFFPLRSELLEESEALSPIEKKVLVLLNDNSRMRMGELVQRTKSTEMKVTYALRKLKKRGIIKRFAALVQNPDKRILYAYGIVLTPKRRHKQLYLNFAKELVEEDLHEATNDYGIMASSSGAYDGFFMCNFKDGESLAKRGPDLIERTLKPENPIVEKAVLTDMLIGKWPFHLEEYDTYRELIKKG